MAFTAIPAFAGVAQATIEWRTETPFRLFGHDHPTNKRQGAVTLSQANDPRASADALGRQLIQEIGRAEQPTDLAATVAGYIQSGMWPYRGTRYDRGSRRYQPGYALPETHAVLLELKRHDVPGQSLPPPGGTANAEDPGVCRWQIEVASGEARTLEAPCTATLRADIETPYGLAKRTTGAQGAMPVADAFQARASARVCTHPAGDAAPCDRPEGWTTWQAIHVNDRLVLGLGDSYASGEGNPDQPVHFPANILDTPPGYDDHILLRGNWLNEAFRRGAEPAEWWDAPCRRSLLAWQALSAMKLAADPHASITFVSFACSGAGVQDGLVEPQRGIGESQLSQIDASRQSLCLAVIEPGKVCARKDQRPIDALLLNIGGNDAPFADLVRWAMLPARGNPLFLALQDAVAKRADPEDFKKKSRELLPTRLACASSAIEDQLNVAPNKVWLAQYPSPLAGSGLQSPVATVDGAFDGLARHLGLAYQGAQLRLTQSESAWAQQQIEGVFQDAYDTFVAKKAPGWNYVRTADAFATHGYWRLPPICDAGNCKAPPGEVNCKAEDEKSQCGQCRSDYARRVSIAAEVPLAIPEFTHAFYRCVVPSPAMPVVSPLNWSAYRSNDLWFRTTNTSLYTQLRATGSGSIDTFQSIAGTAHPTLDGHAAMTWRVLESGLLAEQMAPAASGQ